MAQSDVVAAAAMAWHHARLHRLAVCKQYAAELRIFSVRAVEDARKAECKALAGLRKACREADPASMTFDVAACEVIESVTLLA